MTVVVNGETRNLSEPATVTDLLRELDLAKAACAVEVNKSIVPKPKHAGHRLCEGDQIEIVTLVGGG